VQPPDPQHRDHESAVATAPDPTDSVSQDGSNGLLGRPFRLRLPGRG
jgi:hypothetical protein